MAAKKTTRSHQTSMLDTFSHCACVRENTHLILCYTNMEPSANERNGGRVADGCELWLCACAVYV